MTELSKGVNTALASAGKVRIVLGWDQSPADLDITCFMVKPDGKVPGDGYMVFYNQPRGPGGTVMFSQPASQQAEFAIDLDTLPNNIQKCVFTATLDGPGIFSEVSGFVAKALPVSGSEVIYRVTDASAERALIIAEVYRHRSGWKIRAVGQGFNGGLEPLAQLHGVEVADEPKSEPEPPPSSTSAPPPPPPVRPPPPQSGPVSLSKVVLAKQNDSTKINLAKQADGKIEHIHITMRWTAAVDLDLHAFYKTKSGKFGHVYYVSMGNLQDPPCIQLDRDAGVGATAGNNVENLSIATLDHVEAILIATHIFGFFGGRNESFAKYDGRVLVKTSLSEIEVPLTSSEPGRWAIIAKIENLTEPKVININQIQQRKPKLEDFMTSRLDDFLS